MRFRALVWERTIVRCNRRNSRKKYPSHCDLHEPLELFLENLVPTRTALDLYTVITVIIMYFLSVSIGIEVNVRTISTVLLHNKTQS